MQSAIHLVHAIKQKTTYVITLHIYLVTVNVLKMLIVHILQFSDQLDPVSTLLNLNKLGKGRLARGTYKRLLQNDNSPFLWRNLVEK